MAQANDSITVTPGSGVNVATQLASDGKEYQVMLTAGPSGNILGTSPSYSIYTGTQTSGAGGRNYLSIHNATGSGKQIKVRRMYIQPSGATVTGVSQTWRLSKTSTAGSGGTAAALRAHDSVDPAVPAQVTAGYAHTTLPTVNFTYWEFTLNPEETLPIWGIQPFQNILPTDGGYVTDYALREGEGLMLQNMSGLAYTYSILAVCSVI